MIADGPLRWRCCGPRDGAAPRGVVLAVRQPREPRFVRVAQHGDEQDARVLRNVSEIDEARGRPEARRPEGRLKPLAAQLRDSKKLSPRVRAALASQIHETADVGVGRVSCAEIDARGLGWARREVFLRALRGLSAPPGAVVVDGTGFFDGYGDAPFRLVPRADDAYAHVAAASIVAKDFRDTLVRRTCEASPGTARIYGWAQNKGYPSAQHRAAILAHGRTTVHRASFAPCARAPLAAHVCAVTASDV